MRMKPRCWCRFQGLAFLNGKRAFALGGQLTPAAPCTATGLLQLKGVFTPGGARSLGAVRLPALRQRNSPRPCCRANSKTWSFWVRTEQPVHGASGSCLAQFQQQGPTRPLGEASPTALPAASRRRLRPRRSQSAHLQ